MKECEGEQVAAAGGGSPKPWSGTPTIPLADEQDGGLVEQAAALLAGYLAQPGGVELGVEVLAPYLRMAMHGLQQNRVDMLMFDKRGRLLAHRAVFHGTVDRVTLHPREVAYEARALRAHAVVMAEWRCVWNDEVPPAVSRAASVCRKVLELCGIDLRGYYVAHAYGVAQANDREYVMHDAAPDCTPRRVPRRRSRQPLHQAPSMADREFIASATEVLARHRRDAGPRVNRPELAFPLARTRIGEVVGRRIDLLSLDQHMRLLSCDVLASSDVSALTREIARIGLRHNATAVIVVDHDRSRSGYVSFDVAGELESALSGAALDIALVDYLMTNGVSALSWLAGEAMLSAA